MIKTFEKDGTLYCQFQENVGYPLVKHLQKLEAKHKTILPKEMEQNNRKALRRMNNLLKVL